MCPTDVSDLRDVMTIKSRVEKEGVSFLTLTLPAFGKAFEQCLEAGVVSASCFPGFRKHGAIPVFLQGMLGQVFDRETGLLLRDSSVPVFVYAIRQLCLAYKKLELPCTFARKAKAIDEFLQVEQDLSTFSLPSGQFSLLAGLLWGRMLRDIRVDMLVPRHGPGATAERISGNRKYVWVTWHERLERVFPFLANALPASAALEDEFENVTFLPEEQEPPSRLVLVPKTLKSPRTIAVEPVCMQYAQQAVSQSLVKAIEEYCVTKGQVNFTDQSINQQYALSASETGEWATIDLSSASDRVPRSLALAMFDWVPDLRDLIDACRTRSIKLPDGRVTPLNKFASMGNALCFPIEAMYFYTICIEALIAAQGMTPSWSSILACRSQCFVYGDDIIVPTKYVGAVLDNLAKYNCKVNRDKTFVSGRFRESCGLDAYAGERVTPLYFRRVRPRSRKNVQEVASWVATANQAYERGFWRLASYMFDVAERLLGVLPYGAQDYPGLCRVSFLGYRSIERWDSDLHRFLSEGFVVDPVECSDNLDGYSALQFCLLHLENRRRSGSVLPFNVDGIPRGLPSASLEHSSLRGAATLKRRWNPA